jgi:uncharacterized membrane protein
MILAVPIWVTVLLVVFVFSMLRDASIWLVEAVLLSRWGARAVEAWGLSVHDLERYGLEGLPIPVRWGLAILAVVITVAAIYLLGAVATNLVGRRMISRAERLVDRVPVVKTIYRASKQILETFTGESAREFTRVALVPFPSREVCSVGFITSRTIDRVSGQEYCAVFIATTPNPTTGFVFLVRRSDLVELDWSTDEAIRTVMSGGVLLAPEITLQRPGAVPPAPPAPRAPSPPR